MYLSLPLPICVLTFLKGTAEQVDLIWAWGATRPSADVAANLLQHEDSGPFSLDLTKTLAASQVNSGGNSTGSTGGSISIPYKPYQKTIIVHGSVVAVGFLIFLPGGVFLARYTRTWNNRWFTGHWIVQFGICESTSHRIPLLSAFLSALSLLY